jgi:MFS family permease
MLSGAFGSLLAGFIIESMEGVADIRGWKWLFIVEGSATTVAALFAMYSLPDWPETTVWLNEDERVSESIRLSHDKWLTRILSSAIGL